MLVLEIRETWAAGGVGLGQMRVLCAGELAGGAAMPMALQTAP